MRAVRVVERREGWVERAASSCTQCEALGGAGSASTGGSAGSQLQGRSATREEVSHCECRRGRFTPLTVGQSLQQRRQHLLPDHTGMQLGQEPKRQGTLPPESENNARAIPAGSCSTRAWLHQ